MAANGNNDVIFEKYQDSFSKEEFDLLEKKFALIDDDGDGYINFNDLKTAQSKMGKFKTQKDLESILKQSSSSPKGITFADIVSFVSLQKDDPSATGYEFRLAKDIIEFDIKKFETRSASDAGFKKVHEQYKNTDGGGAKAEEKKVGFKDLLARFGDGSKDSSSGDKATEGTVDTRQRSKTMPANKLEDFRKRKGHQRQSTEKEVPEWLKKRREMQKRKAEKEAQNQDAEKPNVVKQTAEKPKQQEAVTPPPKEKRIPPTSGIKKVTIIDVPQTLEKPAQKKPENKQSTSEPNSILKVGKSKSNPVVETKTGINRLRAETTPERPKARKSKSARSITRDKVRRKKSSRTIKDETKADRHHHKAGELATRKRRNSHKSSSKTKDRKKVSREEAEKLFIKPREQQDSNFDNFNEDTIKYIQNSQLEKNVMRNFYSTWGNKPMV